jgi:hypothetical protein
MLIPSKHNGYHAGARTLHISSSGGGSSGPTSSTVTQSNIPDWLQPQVESLLGAAGQQFFNYGPDKTQPITDANGAPVLDANGQPTYKQAVTSTKPFTPYSTNPNDYVAGFSPLQQQVQANAANLQVPGQFSQGTDLAGAAGQGGMQSAQQALGYGQAGFQSGQQGQQIGTQGGAYYGNQGAGYGQQAAGLANSAMGYGGQGAGYGAQAASLANTALGYGQNAADIGTQAQQQAMQTGQGISNQAQNYAAQQAAAGQNYASQATNPNAVSQYMNPYMQNVVNVQNTEAQRQADIASQSRGAAASRAGAFGGARQAIEDSEAQRNLATLMNANQATGSSNAYNSAMQNMQYGSSAGLQGLAGAQSGLSGAGLGGGQLGLSGANTALQGQQGALSGVGQAGSMYGLGMQGSQAGLGGVNAANQAYQTGIQGAQAGLQGVNTQLAGTAQGMQGAGMGLQGVSGAQAGYGLANQAAGTLGQLGTQQNAAQQGILSLQNQVGGQQQAQQQSVINNAINNYAQAQQQPLQDMNNYNALLRGYAVPGQTTTQYQAAPSAVSQLGGLGVTALAANQLTKKKGGLIKKSDGLDTLGMYNVMKGRK